MHLGEMLLSAGLVSQDELEHALAYQKSIGGRLGQILVKLGTVDESKLLKVLSHQMKIPTAKLPEDFVPDSTCIKLIPKELLEKHLAVPVKRETGALVLAVSDPTDFVALDEMRLHVGAPVELVLISARQARDILRNVFGAPKAPPPVEETAPGGARRARRGRFSLSDLIESLGPEASGTDAAPPSGALDFFACPLEVQVMSLIMILEEKGLLSREHLLAMARRIMTEASPDSNSKKE